MVSRDNLKFGRTCPAEVGRWSEWKWNDLAVGTVHDTATLTFRSRRGLRGWRAPLIRPTFPVLKLLMVSRDNLKIERTCPAEVGRWHVTPCTPMCTRPRPAGGESHHDACHAPQIVAHDAPRVYAQIGKGGSGTLGPPSGPGASRAKENN